MLFVKKDVEYAEYELAVEGLNNKLADTILD